MEFFHCLMLKIMMKVYLYSMIWGQDLSPSGGKNCSQTLLCCVWQGKSYSLNVVYHHIEFLEHYVQENKFMYYANCHHLSYVCWQCLKKKHLLGSKVHAGKFSEEFDKFFLYS